LLKWAHATSVEQLQPCIDAGATAVLLFRLPLLAIDAVSLSKGVEEGVSGAFVASEQDLVQGDGHCMAAAVTAHKNGAYMWVILALHLAHIIEKQSKTAILGFSSLFTCFICLFSSTPSPLPLSFPLHPFLSWSSGMNLEYLKSGA